ncbi:hypothetical protein [Novosphingobium sp. 9U]|uniref:hypothetical protein n=1 Tax=Novosphingobium sp. 9U TaxID=2653158 RepID=UPI0012F0E359|nr:hypothetical protein [Novosphingobium sp. 9U]VWX54699.1 conserved exported hypothetical protein [Novosphingobium sp. 9U]
MWLRSAIVAAGLALAQPASAQQVQPSAAILGQALDRCMVTFAVRLTKTPASDDAIYDEATRSCAPLDARFRAAAGAELEPKEGAQLLKEMDAARRPNFINLLARIRSDRAKRAAAGGQ